MKQVSFKRWSEFRSFIDEDRQIVPVCWRGQSDSSWPLASQFERQILQMSGGMRDGASMIYPYDQRYTRPNGRIWSERYYKGMRDRYLKAFKQAASGLRGSNPAELDTDQWWALGRHHGLVTPLLDWTEKPYIAAFFALTELYSKMSQGEGGLTFEGREVSIYRLFHNEQLEGDGLRVVRPLVNELGRMRGQRSVFTWLESEDYFELQGFLDNTGRGELLTQITISDQALMDGLRDLKAHGIDHRLLFPDLAGATQYANSLWDVF